MTAPPAAAPTDVAAAAELVRKSRLVPDRALAGVLADLPAGGDLLHELLSGGLLTRFQAQQLGRGKWKGFVLGTHYRLLDVLGQGGMGTVYLAEHAAMRKRVAIKVLTPDLAADEVSLARFAREARAAAKLVHPNVVHTIDVDPDASPPFLVLEYVDGVTLQAAVSRTGTFAAETAAFCGVQTLQGLQKAHELGLVHRDVKPANIMVDRRGVVKLLDLGIVRTESGTGALTMAPGAAKVILGTADYLAPEQAMDSSKVDTRADIYGLGSTLYFLLAGHPPYPDGPAARKLVAKQLQDPPPIHTLRPDVGPGLSAVVARLLARNPADRYATPAAAAEALAPFAAPESGFPARLFGQPADVRLTPPPVGQLVDPTPSAAPPFDPVAASKSNLHYVLPAQREAAPPPEPDPEPEAEPEPEGLPTKVTMVNRPAARPDRRPLLVGAGLAAAAAVGLAAALVL